MPLAGMAARHDRSTLSITLAVLILMTARVHHQAAGIQSLIPDHAADRDHAAAGAEPGLHPPDPGHGHEGTDAAGHVIEAFGNFVMQGNFVIGVIVFAILIIVNFVVITKGSGRIAEVAARFTLDAMPGKQMAIDADLSAGLIDEAEKRANAARPGSGKQFLRRHGRRLQVRARRRGCRPLITASTSSAASSSAWPARHELRRRRHTYTPPDRR
jgi:hypothetical protein